MESEKEAAGWGRKHLRTKKEWGQVGRVTLGS